ncbi:isopenicillin N synthase family dioxygenase [Sphingobium sp. Ant17]|uniref:isopenicillin N synthase family dioxygenase n=1 Tax=Sphingobium sp. Ant17 TaxID=1461752 RepID=UPI000450720F|nr:2-oxoglutarate and iron-dependent oxygenase domain-containing protein [Sphingobium sp. Ant17]EXS71219.1 2OG-Fe(II) oxygenase [Sphingobium sp. Ant17]
MNHSDPAPVHIAPSSLANLPVVNISGLLGGDAVARAEVVATIRAACLDKGFFYCVGHGVPPQIIAEIFREAERFFSLPMEAKLKVDKALSRANRGYEPLRGQTLEPGMPPDLKEGFYLGIHVDADDHRASRHFNVGPNLWPESLPEFQAVTTRYLDIMQELAVVLLGGIALSLDLPGDFFDPLKVDPLATLRLLHYPPQPANSAPGEKGCGAHTDFGGITILLQDGVGGLQVWDHDAATWLNAHPIPGAFIVNLGDLIGRWTNDRYRSTVHRVINSSGRERYSVPFFFAGNPDHRVECIKTCLSNGELAKYPPVTVDEHMRRRYEMSYK